MERHLRIRERRVRYLEEGRGNPLVLLHAFPLGAAMWRPQLADVPAGWRVLAPDLRGFAGSPRTRAEGEGVVADPAERMDDHALDVFALLDALDIEQAVFAGLSLGGYVAFACHRLAPGRVRGLVLADTRAEADTEEGRANRRRMLASLETEGLGAVTEAMVPKLLGETSLRTQPALETEVRALIGTNTVEGVGDAIRCLMSRPDATPQLASIQCPTQLIVGREDVLTPVALHEEMQRRIAGAALSVIEGAGHLSNLERPDVFNRTLARFLASWR